MNGSQGLLIISCDFIMKEGNEPNNLNQNFGFVDNQLMHVQDAIS
jgi:hypothetical protein